MATPTNPYPGQTGYGTAMDPMTPQPMSPEPQIPQPPKQMDPKSAIDQMYQQNLGRGSDEGGLGSWLSAYQGGMSLDDINNAIRNSQEGQNYQTNQTINSFYNDALGRNAEQTGLDSWRNALQGGSSMDDIRDAIYTSQEAHDYKMASSPKAVPIEPDSSSPYPADLITPYPSQTPDGQGFSIPQPKTYVDPYAGTPYEGTGGPSAPYRGDFNGQGILLSNEIDRVLAPQGGDPVYDFVQNITQQPQYLQRAFQAQLQRLGDPVAAGRAVLGSLR